MIAMSLAPPFHWRPMRLVSRAVLPIIALMAVTQTSRGQASSPDLGKLTGTVLDTAQMPIVGAIVELLGLGAAPNDSGGVFRFVGLPAGSVVAHTRPRL